jgi:hypothetical protein
MKGNGKIRVYSFYYMNTTIPIENDVYVPVMAGKILHTGTTKLRGDDTGDSISGKNQFFSELTGIYWVWKNTTQDIVGCCHYRRYFSAQDEPFDYKLKRVLYKFAGLYKKRYGLIYTGNLERFRKKIIGQEEIGGIFQHFDAILPQKRKLKYTVKNHYERYHNKNDLKIIEDILRTISPEFLPAYSDMLGGKRLYANNMFILPAEHFNRFMSWWFKVLFEFEKRVDFNEYQGYQQRIIGFLAERLLTTWFCHHKLRVKELPVIYFKKLKSAR